MEWPPAIVRFLAISWTSFLNAKVYVNPAPATFYTICWCDLTFCAVVAKIGQFWNFFFRKYFKQISDLGPEASTGFRLGGTSQNRGVERGQILEKTKDIFAIKTSKIKHNSPFGPRAWDASSSGNAGQGICPNRWRVNATMITIIMMMMLRRNLPGHIKYTQFILKRNANLVFHLNYQFSSRWNGKFIYLQQKIRIRIGK